MPVVAPISEGILMGLKTDPAAKPQTVGSVNGDAQASMASGGLQPAFPSPTPVLPIGKQITVALMVIEGMLFITFEIVSKIIQNILSEYNKQYQKASTDQKAAEDQLYEDLKTRQNEIKEEIKTLQEEINTLTTEIEELTILQEEEMSKYEAQVFEYREAGLKAEEQGDLAIRDQWFAKVDELEPWLAAIIQMIIEITNKEISKTEKESELEQKQILVDIEITKDWDTMESLAGDFEVLVPYHPDLPNPPNLPNIPPMSKEGEQIKAARKMFAKWACTPTVAPIGVPITTALASVNAMSSKSSKNAAKEESENDALLLKTGGVI